jgi:hypothetical protein
MIFKRYGLMTLLLAGCISSSLAAEFRVTVVANPTGWDVNTIVENDLDRFRELGQTESDLAQARTQLSTQYGRLSKAGTHASGIVNIENQAEVVRYRGSATWSHLDNSIRAIEGEIHNEGSVEIRRKRDRVQLYVFDHLRSNTLLSPIDLAIISGNMALVSTIKSAHEARKVIVDGQEVPLYRVQLTTEADGAVTGYTISQSAPSNFVTATLVKQDGKWHKMNFRSTSKLERATTIEVANSNPVALAKIDAGTAVSDHRDHQLGPVVYGWNGQVPAVQALASMNKRSSSANLGLMALALAVVGGGFWMIKGSRKKGD